MKLAAVILVSVGSVGHIVAYLLMRRKLEQLHRFREGGD
jgi:hypothetical protein